MIHEYCSAFAGCRMKIKPEIKNPHQDNFAGSILTIDDYWDRISGASWMDNLNNKYVKIYAQRVKDSELPEDNEVLYGEIGLIGYLIHITEIE